MGSTAPDSMPLHRANAPATPPPPRYTAPLGTSPLTAPRHPFAQTLEASCQLPRASSPFQRSSRPGMRRFREYLALWWGSHSRPACLGGRSSAPTVTACHIQDNPWGTSTTPRPLSSPPDHSDLSSSSGC